MKLSFIGCGNMGGAILDGILSSHLVNKEDISVCVSREESALRIKKEKGVYTTLDAKDAVKDCDIVILAVKPFKFDEVIPFIKEDCKDKLIISVAAGVTIAKIKEMMECDTLHVVRTMPNTPACVQEALSSVTFNEYVNEEEKAITRAIFTSFGKIVEVEEDMIHTVICMSGSSPAYVFMLLTAMVEFGEKHGLSREQAMDMAGQAVLGSAKMLLETHNDPDVMKKNVCSPKGTTIEAVLSFEKDGFYEMVDKAMQACYDRSVEMSKE